MTPQAELAFYLETAKAVREYLGIILKNPLNEFGLLVHDEVRYWRFKNQVRIVERARQFLDGKGIDASKIADSVLPEAIVPLIEAAGDTSDPNLSELFAGLLASAINPATAEMTHRSFASILSQLSPLDAVIVRNLYTGIAGIKVQLALGVERPGLQRGIAVHRQTAFLVTTLMESLKRSEKVIELSFHNLRRLGICDHGAAVLANIHRSPVIAFTDFGLLFAESCIPDELTKLAGLRVEIEPLNPVENSRSEIEVG